MKRGLLGRDVSTSLLPVVFLLCSLSLSATEESMDNVVVIDTKPVIRWEERYDIHLMDEDGNERTAFDVFLDFEFEGRICSALWSSHGESGPVHLEEDRIYAFTVYLNVNNEKECSVLKVEEYGELVWRRADYY